MPEITAATVMSGLSAAIQSRSTEPPRRTKSGTRHNNPGQTSQPRSGKDTSAYINSEDRRTQRKRAFLREPEQAEAAEIYTAAGLDPADFVLLDLRGSKIRLLDPKTTIAQYRQFQEILPDEGLAAFSFIQAAIGKGASFERACSRFQNVKRLMNQHGIQNLTRVFARPLAHFSVETVESRLTDRISQLQQIGFGKEQVVGFIEKGLVSVVASDEQFKVCILLLERIRRVDIASTPDSYIDNTFGGKFNMYLSRNVYSLIINRERMSGTTSLSEYYREVMRNDKLGWRDSEYESFIADNRHHLRPEEDELHKRMLALYDAQLERRAKKQTRAAATDDTKAV
jgi:hypothetical protein